MAATAEEVATAHRLSVADLRSPSRVRPIVQARQAAMAAMREIRRADGRPRYSHAQIARFFGLGRHSTVIHAIKAYARRRAGDGRVAP
jgi:chromosomal replication initiation ATPase DnaA